MLAASWRRWTSIIADAGRELDLPSRLLNGETLYRDIHYLYPPLAPYLNAKLFQLFGIRLETLQASGIVCSLLIVWLSYRIARHLMPPRESKLATLSIIVLCVFKPTGNLISPYAYAALYALALVLASLLITLRAVQCGKIEYLYAAGLFIALAALMKLEFAIAAFGAVMVAVALAARGDWRGIVLSALPLTPIVLLTVPASFLLFQRHGWTLLVEDCHLFFTHLPQSLIFYNRQRAGIDQPLASLWQMLGALSVSVAVVCAVVWFSAKSLRRRALLAGGGALACALLVALTAQGRWDGSPLRALPLWLAALLWLGWRQREQSTEQKILLVIAAYSLAMLARVALRVPSGGAFGSFFLPTSLILVCYGLTQAVPRALQKWTKEPEAAARAQRIGSALLLSAVAVTALVFGIRYRRNFTYAITTPRGSFFTTADSGAAYREALDFLAAHTQPTDAIAVFPEGSDLAYFSARRMPLRHQIYIPGLMSAADETRVIEQLRAQPIRYVLLVNRQMREFGAVAFGRDFYQRLGEYLARHYRIAKVCGLPNEADATIGDSRFFIKILVSKDAGMLQ